MQPVKIIIPGQFYESQSENNKLLLWTMAGDLEIYDWILIVSSLSDFGKDNMALTDSLLRARIYFYPLFYKHDLYFLIKPLFNVIAGKEYEVMATNIPYIRIKKQPAPGKLLPICTEIVNGNLYFINEKGLFSARKNDILNVKKTGSEITKHWDGGLFSIGSNNRSLMALSGGEEGLFELDLFSKTIKQLSTRHSSFTGYLNGNILSSSYISDSFLLVFNNFHSKENGPRILAETNEMTQVFGQVGIKSSFAWTDGKAIFRINNSKLESAIVNQNQFWRNSFTDLPAEIEDVIIAGTTPIGHILETENALYVMQSDGDLLKIPGPITKWRTFSHHANLRNQLHVILEDRLEIYAFNHIFFRNSKEENSKFGSSNATSLKPTGIKSPVLVNPSNPQ